MKTVSLYVRFARLVIRAIRALTYNNFRFYSLSVCGNKMSRIKLSGPEHGKNIPKWMVVILVSFAALLLTSIIASAGFMNKIDGRHRQINFTDVLSYILFSPLMMSKPEEMSNELHKFLWSFIYL